MKNYSFKVAVTGGDGQLGSTLKIRAATHPITLFTLTKSELDITHYETMQSVFLKLQPNFIINTAAFTAVDQAEISAQEALHVNGEGTQNLVKLSQKFKIPLLHLSTDYVFDGTKQKPYHEKDPTNPLNQYGKSKILSEQLLREGCDEHLILRLSGVFSEYKNNFVKSILRLAQEKKELNVVADQISCPTYAGDIADAILSILAKYIAGPITWGTYHFCSRDAVSWYQFAQAIVEEAEKACALPYAKINAISANDYGAAAKRPAYSVLNCERISQNFSIQQPNWQQGLRKTVNTLLASELLS